MGRKCLPFQEVGLPDACRTEVEASDGKEKIRLDHLNFLKARIADKENTEVWPG